MKRNLVGVLIFLLCWAVRAQVTPVSLLLGPSTNVVIKTNVTSVYSNVLVVTPSQKLTNVLVVGWQNTLARATVLNWKAHTNQAVTDYGLYYGKTADSVTNKILVPGRLTTTVALFNLLDTNAVYWFTVTALSGTNESAPSFSIIATGK